MIIINEKEIEIYYPITKENKVPIIILNTSHNEGKDVWERGDKNFILVTISKIDWNKEMTPWPSKNIIGKQEFEGKADTYLEILNTKIIPKIKQEIEKEYCISYYALVGYSLSGLFAVYASAKTNTFKKIASISGSLWYPGLVEFIQDKDLSLKSAYFSLGNKEKNSKNELLKTVEEKTKEVESIFRKHNITTIYEESEGNHFQNIPERIIKGIEWLLQDDK